MLNPIDQPLANRAKPAASRMEDNVPVRVLASFPYRGETLDQGTLILLPRPIAIWAVRNGFAEKLGAR